MSPELLAGRYELREPIGSGGMARVLVAYDRTLARTVAVKLLDRDTGIPHARERFVREARMAASLSHPHAVAVYDTGTDDGTAFIVMELVDGENLAQALRRDGPMGVDAAVGVVDPVLAALGAAHDRGLVHRDVKPGNVLLGRDGSVKLADFGIAKVAEGLADLTMTGQVIGTPTYLAPEQAAGRPATAASDLYAGVVLYEALAGHAPFRGGNAIAVALAHQRDEVPPLDAERPGLPPALVAAVHRALAKDPADRHRDAAAFRAALKDDRGRAGPALAAAGAPTVTRAGAATVVASRGSPPGGAAGAPRPAGRAPGRRGRAGRGPVLVGGAVVALLLVSAAALGLMDDGVGTARPEASPSSGAASPAAPTSSLEALVTAPNLGGFAALLEADPGVAGPRGADLADGIAAVRAADGSTQSDAARALMDRIDGWAAAGELDTAVAERAAALVAGLAGDDPAAAPAPEPEPQPAEDEPPADDAPTAEPPAAEATAPDPDEEPVPDRDEADDDADDDESGDDASGDVRDGDGEEGDRAPGNAPDDAGPDDAGPGPPGSDGDDDEQDD